jgi:hypothetical protein
VASGDGSSFGEALVNALAAMSNGVIGVRRSFTAKGWHAQISKLTDTPRGYEAAAKAGLSVNQRTLLDWLAERREPNAENQSRIAKAYAIMAGRWPQEAERMTFAITGQVSIGNDSRVRGLEGNAPLLIDGSQASANDWEPMRTAWESGDVSPDQFADDFISIIEADLGEFSVPPEFDGSDYTVVIS